MFIVALFSLIVFFALLVEAVVGFGASVLAVSLGVLVLPLDEVLGAFVPVNLCLSLAIAVRHRDAIDWRLLTRSIAPWMLVGFPFGVLLRHVFALQRPLGVFVILLGLREWSIAGRLMLFLGGVAHGALGTGGPLVVYSVRRALFDPRAVRATLAALWAVLNALLLVSLADRVAPNAWLLLPTVAAIVFGDRVARQLDRAIVARVVSVLFVVCGAALLLR